MAQLSFTMDNLLQLYRQDQAGDLARRKANDERAIKVFEARAKQEKEVYDRSKETVGRLIDSHNNASSGPAMKGLIKEQMRNLYDSFPDPIRQALSPYIAHSPISPEAEKAARFDEMNPEPPRPGEHYRVEPNFGKGPFVSGEKPESFNVVQEMGAPKQYAEEFFRYSDWQRLRSKVVFGQALDKENFLSFPEGGAAIRTAEGRISIYNQNDLGLKDLAEKLGKTTADVISGQGYLYSQEFKAIEGDKLVTYKVGTSVVPGLPPTKLLKTNVTQAPIGSPEAYPQGLTDFLIGFAGNDEKKHPDVKRYNELFEDYDSAKSKKDKGAYAAVIKAQLAATFPGYSFRFEPSAKTRKTSFLGISIPYTGGVSKFIITPIRGVPRNFGTEKEPKILWLDENDFLYDANNLKLGNLNELNQILGGK